MLHDDSSSGGKPHADTFADFTVVGREGCGAWEMEGGIKLDGDRGKISGSESPQDAPRVRSFTLIAPVRSKPELAFALFPSLPLFLSYSSSCCLRV